MAKIIFLGTASSIPTKDRDNTAFVFIHKSQTFLIDCPGAIVHKLLKANVDFKKLQNVVITHEHPDHIYGIISLIHTQAGLNDRLNIFTNNRCKKIVESLRALFNLDRDKFPQIHYIDVFKKNPFYSKDGLRLSSIENKHMQGSFGVKFSSGKKSLFYTSDTSFSASMIEKAGKLNYLIHDCTGPSSSFSPGSKINLMHTDSKTLSEYLKDKPDTKLIPVHFLLLKKGEEKRIRAELKPLGKRCVFVKDFEVVRL
ncbi:MAG: ribonuclease Z [Candidatus Omnitrophota bacterium]|nr:MAG: ribonuclease Z [Candidatus Omnitrophota bacterium]